MISCSDVTDVYLCFGYNDNKITLGVCQNKKSFLYHEIINLEFSFIILSLKFSFTRYR
jgi:hypothetical protein